MKVGDRVRYTGRTSWFTTGAPALLAPGMIGEVVWTRRPEDRTPKTPLYYAQLENGYRARVGDDRADRFVAC